MVLVLHGSIMMISKGYSTVQVVKVVKVKSVGT